MRMGLVNDELLLILIRHDCPEPSIRAYYLSLLALHLLGTPLDLSRYLSLTSLITNAFHALPRSILTMIS